ncbi:hypothetical protein VPH35_039898 [Triticum aestivum]|uniref:Uncharacterized protein n=1 Tax=Aegilops tauschii subsp. strangulata TaxID=200361 RepID=A0A453CZ99_AEGTS
MGCLMLSCYITVWIGRWAMSMKNRRRLQPPEMLYIFMRSLLPAHLCSLSPAHCASAIYPSGFPQATLVAWWMDQGHHVESGNTFCLIRGIMPFPSFLCLVVAGWL